MNEQTLYTSLLKGVIIGKLSYANSLATYYSKWLVEREIDSRLKPKIIDDLKVYYGDIMEPDEESEMEDLFKQTDKNSLISFLKNLEENYNPHFLNLIAKRRNKVDTVYTDVFDRTKVVIEDDDVHEIKLAESNKNASLAGTVWKKITENERKAITYFYQQSFSKINHLVVNNSGDEDDASDIWAKSQCEFSLKLEKMPRETGYYEWRPLDNEEKIKTSIFTYFYRICNCRWLDVLRKRKDEVTNIDEIVNFEGFEEEEYLEIILEEDLNFRPSPKILKAISQLPESCQKIIVGKHFGGTMGTGLTSKALSLESGLAIGYINNIHKSCLDKLGDIIKPSKF
jgi:hypothetical protein